MSLQDIVNMNEHDKQTIYEAYSVEHHNRKMLNAELNNERSQSASLRFDAQYWRDAWLEQNIRATNNVVGDINTAINYYFDHPNRMLVMTPNNGYFALVEEIDHLFIVFAWTNPKKWRAEVNDMSALIKQVMSYGKPVRYVGESNVMANHSVDIGDGLFELRF